MKLTVQQVVRLPPTSVWQHLTDPALMNRWSSAQIRLLSAGDEGRADGVGTLREVRLPGRGGRLREVVQVSEGPRRFVYRVIDHSVIAEHRGEITLEPSATGTTILWAVDATLRPALLEPLLRPRLTGALEASLATLARQNEPLPDARMPRTLIDAAGDEDWSRAEAILEEQRNLADRLWSSGDPKRWFSRVYEYVTEAQLDWARRGTSQHVRWVLQLIPRFHRLYIDNLLRREAGEPGEVHWEEAFDAMEGKRGRRRKEENYRIGYGLLKGVRAHIEEDLPRALAELWYDAYRDRCDYVRFRGDYLAMGGIFDGATARLAPKMPRSMTPWYARHLPEMVARAWRKKNFYDVSRARANAFERGARIAQMLSSRRS